MSRYTGPSWKQARRLGLSLTGTGKELARRNYVPGQHGPNNRSKLSEYGFPEISCPLPPKIPIPAARQPDSMVLLRNLLFSSAAALEDGRRICRHGLQSRRRRTGRSAHDCSDSFGKQRRLG